MVKNGGLLPTPSLSQETSPPAPVKLPVNAAPSAASRELWTQNRPQILCEINNVWSFKLPTLGLICSTAIIIIRQAINRVSYVPISH